MSLMGVDIGTSGCKVAAYSLSGACLARASTAYTTIRSAPGHAELDAPEVAKRILACIAEVAASTQEDPVRAISVSSLGEALVPVSSEGRILGASILSSDVRGDEYLPLFDSIDPARLFRINPNIPGVNYSFPKICWLRDHRAEEWERTWKLLFWGDYLVYALTGETVTSPSLANRSMLFDIGTESWSEELLGLAGIPRSILPEVVPAGTVAGRVRDQVARELSLPDGVHVVVGGHDQALNALGAGAHLEGSTPCGIGTFECITPVFHGMPDLDRMRSLSLNVEHHVLPGQYLTFLYNQAGALITWFLTTFIGPDAASRPDDHLPGLLAEMPEGPSEVITTPYFEPTGSPTFRTDARGSIVGLRTSTTRGEILKSILEGETLYFVQALSALAALGHASSRFVATGGGAKSDEWLQIKADILGAEFARPVYAESSVLGAALLGGVGAGLLGSVEEAYAPFAAVDRTFLPDPERHAAYRESHRRYEQIVAAMPRYTSR